MYTSDLAAEEKRIQRSSAIITLVIMGLLFVGTMVWWAFRGRTIPPKEKYEMVGAIDFGDYKAGSQKVNTLEPTQEQARKVSSRPTPPQQAEPKPVEPRPQPVVTQKPPSPIEQPKPEPVEKPDPVPPKPVQTQKPAPKPEPKPQKPVEDSKPTPTPPTKEESPKPKPESGGANHGDAKDKTGNSGSPDVKTLDPNGLYTFGTKASGQAFNRQPLALPYPAYNVQEEGEILFDFRVAPDGRVVYVRARPPITKPGLKRVGEQAIRNWRFSRLPSHEPQVTQELTVIIKFKLKN